VRIRFARALAWPKRAPRIVLVSPAVNRLSSILLRRFGAALCTSGDRTPRSFSGPNSRVSVQCAKRRVVRRRVMGRGADKWALIRCDFAWARPDHPPSKRRDGDGSAAPPRSSELGPSQLARHEPPVPGAANRRRFPGQARFKKALAAVPAQPTTHRRACRLERCKTTRGKSRIEVRLPPQRNETGRHMVCTFSGSHRWKTSRKTRRIWSAT